MTLALLWTLLAQAQNLGTLKVKSTITGAEVYLDGSLIGTIPLSQDVPVGTHQLRVVADNYDPFVRKVEIQAGKTTEVTATLSAGGGTVEFSGPAGARVLVDGQDRGALPIRLRDLGPGTHSWKVEAPLFEHQEGQILIEKGKNYLMDVKLESSRGIFVVESTPPGATVILDGQNRGVTPLRLTEVPTGPHSIRLDLDGHASIFRTMDTSDGRRGEVRATLPDSGGSLVIQTGGEGAVVRVNGVEAGRGSRVEVGPYEKGRYLVEIIEGEHVLSQTVSFPAQGTASLKRKGEELVELKPLTQRWGFWAAVGGGAAVCGATAITTAVLLQPEPIPTGDVTVTLP
jgi:hypothetical protein